LPRRTEDDGRTLQEANVVRSIRGIGDWQGSPLTLRENAPKLAAKASTSRLE
jgi:hypothetical protein